MKQSGSRHLLHIAVLAFIAYPSFACASINPPTGVTAAASTQVSGQVNISWSAPDNLQSGGSYYVYRNGGLIANTSDLSFVDQVMPGTYSYTIAAYNASSEVSLQSTASSLLSIKLDTTAPSAPSHLAASVTTSSISLTWNASTDNIAVVNYSVSRNGSAAVVQNGTTYVDSGIAPGVSYSYSVVAYDAARNASLVASIAATTISDISAPTTPTYLYAGTVSAGSIHLSWQASRDDVGVMGYHVYRDGALVATVSSTALVYADTGLSGQTSYIYTVSAFDAVENASMQSVSASATTFAPDITPPSIPSYINVTALSSSSVTITWPFSSDSSGMGGYSVYRDGVQVGTVSSTSYTDLGLASSTTYAYTVAAYDSVGNVSEQSFPFRALTLAPGQTSSLPIPPSLPASSSSGATTFTIPMYYGLRTASVLTLQQLLVKRGYLTTDSTTGFFGALTQKAVQKIQCDQNIVCSGSPAETGWGFVGVKTRKALNALSQ